jgi:hypothetical protein
MLAEPADFKRAVAGYGYPESEPIHCIDFNARVEDSTYPHNPCLVVYRAGGDKSNWHKSMAEFWASALFSFIEDCGELEAFQDLGMQGCYKELSKDEATRVIVDLLGDVTSDYIDVPGNIATCYRVHNTGTMKSFVGSDSIGFLAIFNRSWD